MNSLNAFESFWIRRIGSLLSRRQASASLAVLIFHRVLAARDPLLASEPDAATFAAQMRLLAENFSVLRLTDAVERLRAGTLPPRAICVTFDDGYANNCDIALPILLHYQIPATIFIAPGFLNGGRMFNDTIIEAIRRAPASFDLRPERLDAFKLTDAASRTEAIHRIITRLKHLDPAARRDIAERIAARCGAPLPNDLMMTDEQVRHIHRAGLDIGAHTMTHPILASVDAAVALREIAASKARLEEITGAPVSTFAYPNGRPLQDYRAAHVEMVKQCGFTCALSTAWGTATMHSDRFQLPRLAPWDSTPLRYAARIVRGYRERSFALASA